jgi:DHA1 family tetracycline resistance protein-like MFS transporter
MKHPLIPIFLTVFIDLIGVGIVIPIMAPLFLSPESLLLPPDFSLGQRTLLLGFLIAAFPLAQFFGSPILGALSDRYGRKRLLIISLAGTLIGYVLTAIGIMTHNLVLLFVSRLIDGFTGGNISIAMSSIADLSDAESKPKNFGMIGMAFGLGLILGPFIGGFLANREILHWFGSAIPFWFAALLSSFNIVLLIFLFKETLHTKVHTEVSMLTGFRNIIKAWSMENLRKMFIIVFLLSFGFNFYTQFFQVYLIEKFSFNEAMIGNLFGYMGLWIAFTQGAVTRIVSRYFRPGQVLKATMLVLSASLLMMLIPDKPYMIYFILPFMAVSNGLTWPNSTTIISEMAGKESQGEILGINQSIQSLGQALPPVLAGMIASVNISLPIIVASSCIMLAWIVFVFFQNEKKVLFHEI